MAIVRYLKYSNFSNDIINIIIAKNMAFFKILISIMSAKTLTLDILSSDMPAYHTRPITLADTFSCMLYS